jgi:hypothetical protein
MSGGDFGKRWLTDSLVRSAARQAANAIQITGKALPCSVTTVVSSGIVTVKFEVQSGFTLPLVTCPKAGTEWMRYPTQVGDKGFVTTADAYLGGMSGLGGGVANLTQRGNLTALVFVPLGNTAWSEVDPNAVTLYGPDGVVLRTLDSECVFTLVPSGITIDLPPTGAMVINGNVTINGTLTQNGNLNMPAGYDLNIGGTAFTTHEHGGVQPGPDNTGPPVGGT